MSFHKNYERCLYFTANRLAKNIAEMAENEFSALALNLIEAEIIVILDDQQAIKHTHIADILKCSKEEVHGSLAKLHSRGLIQSTECLDSYKSVITEKGETIAAEVRLRFKRLHQYCCKAIGEDFTQKLTRDIYIANNRLES